ncbi:MAG TPA: NAD(P)H-binding protein [Jiangellaceae bacterium]
MYTIAGVTGQVGSAVADELLAAGQDVRVLVRDVAKGEPWAQRGAQVAVADLRDVNGLTDAVRGSNGVFVLLPLNLTSPTAAAEAAELTDAVGEAIEAAGVPHVVALSSVGADLPEGTGAIEWLHRFENRLRGTGAVLTAVRSGHFQEKARDLLGAVHAAGIYPVLRDTADVPIPMVAVRDVGAVIASALREPAPAHRVVDVEGPEYTERQVAETIASLVGKPVEVVTIPQPGWVGTLVEAGLSTEGAELIAGLYDADQRGVLQPKGDRLIRGRTGLEETLRDLVRTQPAPAG